MLKIPTGILLFFSLAYPVLKRCKEKSLPETFINLLNNYNKDSLNIITSNNFHLTENYVSHSFSKAEFLDNFLTSSKAINGKFKIIKTLSNNEPTVFLVEDITDYSKYLNLKPLIWKMVITTKDGKIEELISDTTAGYKIYHDDFIIKHDHFIKWLNVTYPNEPEDSLFNNVNGLFAKRLKEYSKQ